MSRLPRYGSQTSVMQQDRNPERLGRSSAVLQERSRPNSAERLAHVRTSALQQEKKRPNSSERLRHGRSSAVQQERIRQNSSERLAHVRASAIQQERKRPNSSERRVQANPTRPTRKDSIFGDNENAGVAHISTTYVPLRREANDPGVKPVKVAKSVALPKEKGKAFGENNGKRQKRTFEDRTNYRNMERQGYDNNKRLRAQDPAVQAKPMAVVLPSCSTKNTKEEVSKVKQSEKEAKPQKEKSSYKFGRGFKPRSAVGQVPVEISKPKAKRILDLSDIGEALEEVEEERTLPRGVEDIDINDKNVFSVTEYAHEIIMYIKKVERKYELPRDFADKCPGKGKSRAILNDWLIQVQNHLHLQQQTLHLTVALIDGYLNRSTITLSQLQLLGISSLLVATKYEERFTPSIRKLLHLTDNSYQYRDVIGMELDVLHVLKFSLHIPTPIIFLERGLKVMGVKNPYNKVELLSRFLLDLALPHVKMMSVPASVRAAGALYLSHQLLHTDLTSQLDSRVASLAYYLDTTCPDIIACAIKFAKLLSRAKDDKFQAAREKFGQKTYRAISQMDGLYDNPVLTDLVESLY